MNGEMYILGGKISEGRVEEPMVIFVGVLIVMDDIKLPSSHTAQYKYTMKVSAGDPFTTGMIS